MPILYLSNIQPVINEISIDSLLQAQIIHIQFQRKQYQMSQRIKYKIISYSSQQQEYPASLLAVTGSEGWQTKRFCTYPQQVTLEFYGLVHVDKIEILADNSKIAQSVDILYYDPTEAGVENRFTKYGSLEFSRNENGRIHEQKTVMVDMRCLYMRFLFRRPYRNRENYFSQVHIHELSIYGGENNGVLPLETVQVRKSMAMGIQSKEIQEEEDEFVYQKLLEVQKKKENAVSLQDFDQAERMKQVMLNIKKFGYKLKSLKEKKNQAAEKQDYQLARSIKEEIDRLKKQVDLLVNQALEGVEAQIEEEQIQQGEVEHDTQGNQFVGLEIDKMLDRQGQSRVSQKNSIKNNSVVISKKIDKNNSAENSYDERIVPTLQNKNKLIKTDESQNFQPEYKPQQIGPPQDIDGNHTADASIMMQFFQQETVKQFFSKHWQHKEKSLLDISASLAKKSHDQGLIKCLIRIVSLSITETNFKLSQLSLNLLLDVLKTNAKEPKLTKTSIEQRHLMLIMDQVIKQMTDHNAKIKTLAEQVFQSMLNSSLFGVEYCCMSLMKAGKNIKGNIKQEALRLGSLGDITTKFGLGENGVPNSVVEYAVAQLANPAAEVRNQAVYLLAVCVSKDRKLVENQLEGKKSTYMKQIEAKQKQLSNGKKK